MTTVDMVENLDGNLKMTTSIARSGKHSSINPLIVLFHGTELNMYTEVVLLQACHSSNAKNTYQLPITS